MNHSLLYQAAEMIKKQHRRRNLRTAFTGMASVVVFVTVYMLILPAITLEGKPICGHPEHVHTDACYETVLVCHLSETEGEPPTALPPTRRLICTKEESAGHTHGLNCLDERYLPCGDPNCGLTEADGHEHTLLCYDYLIVCCEEERPAVTQQVPDADPGLAPELDPNGDPTEGDLTDLAGELPAPAAPVMKTVVIDPGHTHGPDCVRPIEECWTCELTESTGHSHTDGCYELVEAAAQPLSADGDGEIHYHKHGPECYQKRLICGKMDHQHTDACFKNAELQDDKYICGQVAHTHTAECGPDGDGSYSCGLQEHTHSAACIPPMGGGDQNGSTVPPANTDPIPGGDTCYCNKEEHVHDDVKCYAPDGTLICDREEHTHTASCLVDPNAPTGGENGGDTGEPGESIPWTDLTPAQPAPTYCNQTEHVHGADCVLDENGVCILAEHVHDDTCCVAPDGEQDDDTDPDAGTYCGKKAHTHVADCDPDCSGIYTCGFLAHEHTDQCYVDPNAADDSERKPTYCGKTEHTHGADCVLGENGVCILAEHVHSDQCFVEPKDDEEPIAYCGVEAHVHSDACKDAAGSVQCGMKEHVHNDQCYIEPVTYCGKQAHTHSKKCDINGDGTPDCGRKEHIHTDECMVEPTWYCGKTAHIHSSACMINGDDIPDCAREEHIHTDACRVEPTWYCGLQEHKHLNDACYNEAGNLACTLKEHTHGDRCRDPENWYYCGFHTHVETCYDEQGSLICTEKTHEHTDLCRQKDPGLKLYTKVGNVNELDPGMSYIVLYQDQWTGETVMLYSDPDYGLDMMPVTVREWDGGAQAAISLPQVQTFNMFAPAMAAPMAPMAPAAPEEESIPDEFLWVPQVRQSTLDDDEPYYNRAVGTTLGSVTDDTTALSVRQYGSELVAGMAGVATYEEGGMGAMPIMAFAAVPYAETYYPGCTPESCTLSSWLTNWKDCTGANPFGGAQDFNIFIFEDLTNWGVVHGNAAIGGNIAGTTNDVTYLEKSIHNYAGRPTPEYVLGLILGGDRTDADVARTPNHTDPVNVHNGSVIYNKVAEGGVSLGETDAHYHVPKTNTEIAAYFAKAKEDLVDRNLNTYKYAMGEYPTDLPPVGQVMSLEDYHLKHPNPKYPAENLSGLPGDLYLYGDNEYINVFNLDASQYSAKTVTSAARVLYLDVPFGSYVIINIKDDGDGIVESFAPHLHLRTGTGEFTSQPSKGDNADWSQTRRVLFNFAPSIHTVTMDVNGFYLYGSVLGPNVNLKVHEDCAVNIEGTVVLNSADGGNKASTENAKNNAFLYNPFMAGSAVDFVKDVVCDSCDGNDTSCKICQQKPDKATNWAGFYVDVVFESITDEVGSIKTFTLEGLPLNGEKMPTVQGITPDLYQVKSETIYRYQTDVDGNIVNDADGKPIKFEKTPAQLWEHSFSHVTFGTGSSDIIQIAEGSEMNVTVVNHYEKGTFTKFKVEKEWKEGDVIVQAPPGAEIQLQLYQTIEKDALENPINGKTVQEPVTLNATTGWYCSWYGLDITDPDSGKDWIYYVEEIGTWPGYDPQKPVHDAKSDTWILVNARNEINVVDDLTVAKRWYNENDYAISGDALDKLGLQTQIQLYQQSGHIPANISRPLTVKFIAEEEVDNGDGTTLTRDYEIGKTEVAPGSDLSYGVDLYVKFNNDWSHYYSELNLLFNGAAVSTSASGLTINDTDNLGDYLENFISVFHFKGILTDIYENKELRFKVVDDESVQKLVNSVYSANEQFDATEYLDHNLISWDGDLVKYTPEGASGLIGLPKDGQTGDAKWRHTWQKLPKDGKEANGQPVYYRYFTLEAPVNGYAPTYVVDGDGYSCGAVTLNQDGTFPDKISKDLVGEMPGANVGIITIQNRPHVAFELPETGGPGVVWQSLGGLVLLSGGLAGLMKRRKGGRRSRR